MGKNLSTHTGYGRYLHEFLFSLNAALVFRLTSARTSFSNLESRLKWQINDVLHLGAHSNVGGYTAFFALALGLALGIFVVLRLCSRTLLARELLRSVAGIVSLLALPVSWLYATHLFPVPRTLPNPRDPWIFLELVATMACAVFYLFARWPLPGWTGVLLLALHFGFWTWLSLGGPYFWRAAADLIFPTVGFFSCLAWGSYVSDQKRTTFRINHDRAKVW
jgi:hypothetical protein